MEQLRTPLHDLSLKAGGRMVPFAGWEMPVQFSGLIQEHNSVRNNAGVFDISHMGVLRIDGQNIKDTFQRLIPTDLHRISEGEACYSVLLNDNGGIIDDLIIYDLGGNKNGNESLIIVINAACFEQDLKWLNTHLHEKSISIKNIKKEGVLLAVQGPKSLSYLEQISEISLTDIPRFGHRFITLKGTSFNNENETFIARTGYTGENGFELLLSQENGRILWSELINNGLSPCGLGSRDTLRLEAAMHLYGQDLNEETTPFEAGLGWLVNLEAPIQFIGRKALETQAEKGIAKKLIGLKMKGKAIARQGYPVFESGKQIGEITSGTWSPTLEEAIALAYVPPTTSKLGTQVAVNIRGVNHPAIVVRRPFYRTQNP
ncbi:glycine cleavage system aminomethyltransferase GcvT [Prochlorococcus sp. MIT 1300]|uniref:glycine cleavage system aminomethyltransferase GcvT n=1 Tax=Prochlorococcus sp. MIT 1300 TaxID=3096218 RepID=UPI002A758447|nr:glycine cleavage system aminomethyltransferase GcvT [Prochlorococcus sp. MIT 1300]